MVIFHSYGAVYQAGYCSEVFLWLIAIRLPGKVVSFSPGDLADDRVISNKNLLPEFPRRSTLASVLYKHGLWRHRCNAPIFDGAK